MIPNVHYYPTKTASQNPFYAAQRLFTPMPLSRETSTRNGMCQMPFLEHQQTQTFTNYPRQPCRSDGTFTHPGCHFKICNAQQGAPDAGKRWEKHRDTNLIRLRWKKLKSEPGAFYIEQNHRHAHLLCTTEDFLVSSSSRTYLQFLRKQLVDLWDITIQSPLTQHTGIAIKRTKEYIRLSTPKHVQNLLEVFNMQDYKPAETPQATGHDLKRHKPDEPPLTPSQHHKYQSALGIAHFIADTVGYKIATAISQLDAYQRDPAGRHMTALKRLARYLKGNPDLGVQYACKYSSTSNNNSPLHIEAWADSDWASCPDTRYSRTGVAFTFAADLLLWLSNRQHAHALSSAEAEFIAACRAARELRWLRQFADESRIPLHPAACPAIPFHLSQDVAYHNEIFATFLMGQGKREKVVLMKYLATFLSLGVL